ncbi:5,6-dimethylbenzimidazole synthase [Rhizorhapis suberifaciens]|uniref:5,6-dimethylbenzimidazole synthase n=1 Tax=Rhizorhapis suberifaciens TaxID=13656 RepID=A0A840HRB0_9SPHN|nr:5,6-dimethylbenzimidazole synthase [Rhizorhapis suberifaciens]MBB4640413.1 5,6-dimethylbenzimidazole synthase [Rhizorhapis suberifaciens]
MKSDADRSNGAGSVPLFDAAFQAQLESLLLWRRDVRHFQRRALPELDMQYLLQSACLAPSVGNAQPWRFIRIRSAALRERLADHVDAESSRAANLYTDDDLRARYRSLKLHGIREAPELLAILSDDHPQAGHRLGIATMPEMLRYSTVMAIHSLWLAARAKGIGVGWVSILDPHYVTGLLEAPDNWTLIALLCIGYPQEMSDKPELARRGWQQREPLADRVIER